MLLDKTENEGILTIATTSRSQFIVDTTWNSPSRFDVKYDFDFPSLHLRKAYALKWINKITSPPEQADSPGAKTIITFKKKAEDLASEIAAETKGWSFSLLKEM